MAINVIETEFHICIQPSSRVQKLNVEQISLFGLAGLIDPSGVRSR